MTRPKGEDGHFGSRPKVTVARSDSEERGSKPRTQNPIPEPKRSPNGGAGSSSPQPPSK